MPTGLILLQVAPASCSREFHGLVMYSVEKALYFWPYRLIHLLSEYPLPNDLPRATLAQNRLEKTAESLCSRILPCFRGSHLLWASISLSDPSLHMQNMRQQFGKETAYTFFAQASKMVLLLSVNKPDNTFSAEVMPCM